MLSYSICQLKDWNEQFHHLWNERVSFCCSCMKGAVFVSPRTFFSTADTSDQVGNIKIKLMDRPDAGAQGREKHWEISLSLFLLGWLVRGKRHKAFLPPGISDNNVPVLHSGSAEHTYMYSRLQSFTLLKKTQIQFSMAKQVTYSGTIYWIDPRCFSAPWKTGLGNWLYINLRQKCKEMQPRVSLAFLAAGAHCRLKFSSVPTECCSPFIYFPSLHESSQQLQQSSRACGPSPRAHLGSVILVPFLCMQIPS